MDNMDENQECLNEDAEAEKALSLKNKNLRTKVQKE